MPVTDFLINLCVAFFCSRSVNFLYPAPNENRKGRQYLFIDNVRTKDA